MIVQGRLLIEADRIPEPGWVAIEAAHITEVHEGDPPEQPTVGDRDAIICPGFTDVHLHLPQIDSIGCEYSDLLDWLDEIVFPAEARWADRATADRQTANAYRRLLRAGTLNYAGYLTTHPTGVDAVRAATTRIPLRGIAGQVLMDRNAPSELLGLPAANLPAASADRLQQSCNPRFAIACSDELLHAAGAATPTGSFVQTHLAEQSRECDIVHELFPDAPHYTGVYDRAGLLTERTLLAHCVHLGATEWALIAERRSVVVHCPTANTFLRSGLFDLGAAHEHGVRLALGSDVAAGPDIAMPRVARAMIEVAKMRAMTGTAATPVPRPADAWRLITEGNADALGFSDGGRLAEGAAADLLVLRPRVAIDEHLVGRLIYGWRDDFIAHRILAGTLVDADLD